MKTSRVLPVLLVGLSLSTLAHAQGPAPVPKEDPLESGTVGLEIGLRTGFALPFGQIADRAPDISEYVTGQVPFWLDAGYRIIPELYVGGYAQYGIGITKNCPSGISCSANDVRLGINVQYHPTPLQVTDPWIGLGFGYEVFNLSQSTTRGESADASAKGWEFANFQTGVDFRASPNFRIGPFVSFSLDQTATISQGSLSSSDFDKALHMWLFFGLRGAFVVGG
ncbi:hypothetical protein LZC95_47840 [Pendulispora brunnea]|uniref:Outer membrane protein beta-barrel domain-containing protein n=1 Tax=Pendulispora brunnea TaxID=2905690 RepID=A0ABZ2KAL8_9BACT